MKKSSIDLINSYCKEIDYSLIDTLASNEIKKELLKFCTGFDETEKIIIRLLGSVDIVDYKYDKNEIKKYIEKLLVYRKIKEKISELIELIEDKNL